MNGTARERDKSVSPTPATPLPWPLTAAVLVAFAAFILNRRQIALPAALAGSIVASLFIPARLRRGSPAHWLMRLGLYGAMLAIVLAEPVALPGPVTYAAQFVDGLTQLAMAELAVQFWQWPRTGSERSALVALLSGFVVVAASKTLERRFFPFLAPAYAVCLVLALRAARARLAPPAQAWRGHLSRAALVALATALLLGFGGAWSIRTYGRELPVPGTDFAMALRGTAGIVGFTETPVLRGSPNVTRSLVRVLRLESEDAGQEGALNAAAHLRGAGYETYSRGRWGPTLGGRRHGAVTSEMLDPQAAGERLRIARLLEDTALLFVPLHCAGIDVTLRGRQPQQPLRFETEQGGSLAAIADAPFEYDVVMGAPEQQKGPLCAPPGAEQRARCLEIPAETEAGFRVLADDIAGGMRDPRERIAAVVKYLRANHAYSLTAQPGTDDPVLDFLLEKKAAHCEFFASAATILLRCVDVPARYVTGYYVHEAAGAGTRVVRQQDAHAWTEAWIDGAGWVTVDATPPAGLPDQLCEQPSFWRRISESLLDVLALPLGKLGAGIVAASAAAATLGFVYWRRRARRRLALRPRGSSYTPPAAPLVEVAEQFEEILRKRSVPCPMQMTWSEHLALLAAGGAAASGGTSNSEHVPGRATVRGIDLTLATAFLREYNAVRFGGQKDSESIGRVRVAFKQLLCG